MQAGRPQPGKCPRKPGNQPHSWGYIGRAIDVPTTEFVKYHIGEEGDDSNDVRVFEAQKSRPLDYDESHYIDQSMGMEKLKEYNLI